MVKLSGGRAASAVIGLFMLALGSNAAAQNVGTRSPATPVRPAVATTAASVAASSSGAGVALSVAAEAAWLYKAGWPLYALVDRYSAGAPLDRQANCLATAVFFEARGESAEGQLAVARVIMNRASSGRYPPDWCGVVKQPAQFSFVRHGRFPYVATASAAWARAQGIARLAVANVIPSVGDDVLWYHATYAAPSWVHHLNMVQRIGAHIFYRVRPQFGDSVENAGESDGLRSDQRTGASGA